ncbi:MAG TPA: diacylglycerol kinase family protein [Flavitalea sp.]|nr:diacylglycerol kinase family protein [Flavitalea sp.]
MKDENFSIRARIRSFKFSFEGLAAFFRKEHNSWIHVLATLVVLGVSYWVGVTRTELLAIVFAIGFVWVAEIFNTCIERMMDYISLERHPDIKFIKDLASGAVLIAALTAVVVALIIFIPKFID